MPKDTYIRKSVKVEPTLEETDEMPIEYLNQDEKNQSREDIINTNGWTGGGVTSTQYNNVVNQSNNILCIGGDPIPFESSPQIENKQMRGDIAIIRIYIGKALTRSEIAMNFAAEKTRYGFN